MADLLVESLSKRYRIQSQVDAPENWKTVYAALSKDDDGEVKKLAQALAINFRDAGAARQAGHAVRRDGLRHPPANALRSRCRRGGPVVARPICNDPEMIDSGAK